MDIFTTGELDTVGVLEDQSGETLATNDDGGSELNFRIQTVLLRGTYYVGVRSFGDHTGDYVLNVKLLPLDGPSIP